MTPCFAIIDSNTLNRICLRNILSEIYNNVDIMLYGDIESFIKDSNRHFVHFFVSRDIFFRNVDEFEPLQPQTTIITEGNNIRISKAGFNILDITRTEQDITAQLLNLQKIIGRHYKSVKVNDKENVRELLSSREIDVIKLIIKGLLNKEIAEELNISMATVIFHRNNICRKLHTRSVGKMTIAAVLSGIVDINEI